MSNQQLGGLMGLDGRLSAVRICAHRWNTLIPIEDNYSMKNTRLAAVGTLVALLVTLALAQKSAQHLLSSDELKKAVPAEFFFRGQKAPTQARNSAGFQTADGKITFAALVDVSGYSTAVQQKYQGCSSPSPS